MALNKCDICEKEKNIRRFPRAKLRKEALVVLKTLGIKNEKIVKTWIHPKLEKLEQTNAGFKRKSRICKDCQKEIGLSK